ncbi:MAG: PD40 domain-containing protein [Chloracidobacterium sp.]|nr:PD40 domain-containing protein [Chloracidobacterium sp.]
MNAKYLFVSTIFLLGLTNYIWAQQKPAPVYYFNPQWSSDGKKIVFESTKDGKSAIYTINADGSNLRKLTDGTTTDGQPGWSRNGKLIVFYSQRDGRLQLYVMNADGSGQRKLTDGADLDYLPDFSPKGDLVVFQSRKEQPGIAHDIYTIRVDGTNRTRLTDEKNGYTSPKWSPDGKRIVFELAVVTKKYYRELSREEMGKMKNSTEIFVMDKDGTNMKNLTNNNVQDSTPQWSKNGKTIYFMSDRDGSQNVYAMDADGTRVRKVADGKMVTNPFISPDEKHFAYTKEVEGKWGLYVYEIKSAKERLLIGGK